MVIDRKELDLPKKTYLHFWHRNRSSSSFSKISKIFSSILRSMLYMCYIYYAYTARYAAEYMVEWLERCLLTKLYVPKTCMRACMHKYNKHRQIQCGERSGDNQVDPKHHHTIKQIRKKSFVTQSRQN